MALEVELERLTKARDWRGGGELGESTSQLSPTGLNRVLDLVDEGSWLEIGSLARSQHEEIDSITPRDGLVTGFGRVAGHDVAVISEDRAVLSRTDGQVAKSKLWKLVRLTIERTLPLIILSDGPTGHVTLSFETEGRLLGRVAPPGMLPEDFEALPAVVAVRFGQPWQEARELLFAADLTIAVKTSSDPTVLVGAAAMNESVDFVADRESDALLLARSVVDAIMDYQSVEAGRDSALTEWPDEVSPGDSETDVPVDLASILELVADIGSSLVFEADAGNLRTALARIGGTRVVVLGPAGRGADTIGVGDLQRVGRTARLARRFGLPLLVIQDVRGYDPTTYRSPAFVAAEMLARQQIQLADVGTIGLVVGDGHVLGRFIVGGRELGYDAVLAWPWANIGVTDVPVFDATQLDAARIKGPWMAAGLGLIEDIITPAETRVRLIRILTIVRTGRRTRALHSGPGSRRTQ